jgi:probable phosphoglycerate mutase
MRTTCTLAGFDARAVVKDDLAEWAYGDYEGVTTKDIRAKRPGWDLFHDGCPNGETAADVGQRADRMIAALRQTDGGVLIFSSSHFLRVLGARWIGLPPENGQNFVLDTASISIVGYNREDMVIRRWNQT